jgi:hypothetical protein
MSAGAASAFLPLAGQRAADLRRARRRAMFAAKMIGRRDEARAPLVTALVPVLVAESLLSHGCNSRVRSSDSRLRSAIAQAHRILRCNGHTPPRERAAYVRHAGLNLHLQAGDDGCKRIHRVAGPVDNAGCQATGAAACHPFGDCGSRIMSFVLPWRYRERPAAARKLCTCQAHDHCASPAVLPQPNPSATLLVSHERAYTERRPKLIAFATVVPP